MLATIRDWDFLLINDSEARQLSGQHNLRRAAEVILGMGPRLLVVKRGEYGAVLFSRDGYFSVPGYLLESVVDPTGAGDSFAGGFIGYLAQQGVDPRAGRDRSEAVAQRGGVRVGDGQLLLREVRCRPFSDADPGGD